MGEKGGRLGRGGKWGGWGNKKKKKWETKGVEGWVGKEKKEEILNIDVSCGVHSNFVACLQIKYYMHTREVHQQLHANLIEHI